MAKFDFLDIRGTKKVPSAFGNVFICSGAIGDAKTVTFPNGYLNGATPEPNLAFKVVFPNGHNAANASSYLSLNGVVVVSNQNGTLAPLPIHEITPGTYSVLQANAVLELYYTESYDGNSHPAFIVVGNPVVLSSSDYTIYAGGKVGDGNIGDIKPRILTNIPYGWLLCNGQSVLRTAYPKLFEYFNTQTYDGVHTLLSRLGYVDITHFNMPDLRESTLKGTGTTSKSSVHYDSDGLTLGEFIDDRIQTHKHNDSGHQHGIDFTPTGVAGGPYSINQLGGTSSGNTDTDYAILGAPVQIGTSAIRIGETTEVKAVGVNYIIKAM